ncbi:MAG: methyltransferase domain-containing protein [Streptosporangiales bacterium]|nr:methyltransferase domain-containing protein [Streptosporangiales bacterium]
MIDEVREYWDGQAARFDEEVDHGLLDPQARAAWTELLTRTLPPAPAAVVDLGCGTGSIAVLLAELSYGVRGLDLPGAMVAAARAKAAAAGVPAALQQGAAANPPYAAASADVVVVRHVLWALPDPAAALAAWMRLLRPAGRLLLVEGSWQTGASITAAGCDRLARQVGTYAMVHPLDDPRLWGGPITDERYLLVTSCPPTRRVLLPPNE